MTAGWIFIGAWFLLVAVHAIYRYWSNRAKEAEALIAFNQQHTMIVERHLPAVLLQMQTSVDPYAWRRYKHDHKFIQHLMMDMLNKLSHEQLVNLVKWEIKENNSGDEFFPFPSDYDRTTITGTIRVVNSNA